MNALLQDLFILSGLNVMLAFVFDGAGQESTGTSAPVNSLLVTLALDLNFSAL